jgi:hypothetical protein
MFADWETIQARLAQASIGLFFATLWVYVVTWIDRALKRRAQD